MSESPTAAIAVPIFRLPLSPAEEISLRHLRRHLASFDRFAVVPEGLATHAGGGGGLPADLTPAAFAADFFRSVEDYSRLLLSSAFYQRFAAYDYLLIYQLDCLVFDGTLLDWCRAGWDYLGAPWLRDPARPERGFSRVGNGGLSLRRVGACLRVLDSPRYRSEPVPLLRDLLGAPLPDLPAAAWPKRLRVLRAARAGARDYAAAYTLNEDHFWSDRARLFLPGFRIPRPEQALGFSFERAPRYCYARNGNRLPLGCHAWQKWDEAFWRPLLIAD